MSEMQRFWKGDVLYEVANGIVRREIPKTSGVARWWYPDGQLAREMPMVSGVADGITREWHENGVLMREIPYRRGVVDGVVKQWNSQGKPLGEYMMTMGRGLERKWNEDGTLSLELEVLAEGCHRGKVWDDVGKPKGVFLWQGRPVSKRVFEQKLAKERGDSRN